MIKIYCDKCGKWDKMQLGFFEITVKAGETYAEMARFYDDLCDLYDYTGHLCPECLKSVREFIRDAD